MSICRAPAKNMQPIDKTIAWVTTSRTYSMEGLLGYTVLYALKIVPISYSLVQQQLSSTLSPNDYFFTFCYCLYKLLCPSVEVRHTKYVQHRTEKLRSF